MYNYTEQNDLFYSIFHQWIKKNKFQQTMATTNGSHTFVKLHIKLTKK